MSSIDKLSSSTPETVFYGPTYQFVIRILLSTWTLIYFFFLPIPLFILNRSFVYIIFFGYFIFHIIWWQQFRKKGITFQKIRLANWVDLTTAGIIVVLDPYLIPPTIVLILISVLGNGIQHGIDNFINVAKNSILVCLASLPLHFIICRQWPPYSFLFLLIFLISCGHYFFFLIKRIELLKKIAEKQAQADELTGLMNRRAFLKSARYLISLHNRMQIPLVFVFADLDGFKNVNDTLGHASGDRVLVKFAELTSKNFRKSDIVSRYGGDEFIFIFVNNLHAEAEKILARLEKQFLKWAAEENINIGISYGIRSIIDEKVELENIIKDADDALYAEKRKKGKAQKSRC